MNQQSVANKLKLLGYHQKWLEYGFLNIDELNEQYSLHKKALQNPDKDEYGYLHTEHLRHKSFLNIFKREEILSDKEIKHLIELIQLDPDRVMASSVMKHMIDMKKISKVRVDKFTKIP